MDRDGITGWLAANRNSLEEAMCAGARRHIVALIWVRSGFSRDFLLAANSGGGEFGRPFSGGEEVQLFKGGVSCLCRRLSRQLSQQPGQAHRCRRHQVGKVRFRLPEVRRPPKPR